MNPSQQIELQHIKARPASEGYSIDLQWLNSMPEIYTMIEIRRKLHTHPTSIGEGHPVTNINNVHLFTLPGSFSQNLDKSIFSATLMGRFSTYQISMSPQAQVVVMTPGTKWKISDTEAIYLIVNTQDVLQVFGLSAFKDVDLREGEVYYYTLFPYVGETSEYIYNRKNRTSAMVTGQYDFAGFMMNLLPLIYHRYDKILPAETLWPLLMNEADKQKGQLRRFLDLPGQQLDQFYSLAAQAANLHDINRMDGKLLPLLGQWIGWESDANREIEKQRLELRNAPDIIKGIGTVATFETMVKHITGWKNRVKEFVHNIFISNRPEQLYLHLCHLTDSGTWRQEDDILSVDYAFEGRPAIVNDTRDDTHVTWLFYHSPRNENWNIRFKTYTPESGWTPSDSLTQSGTETIDKSPTVALQGDTLWLFHSSYKIETRSWQIQYRKQIDGLWSIDTPFDHGSNPDPRQRRHPFAVVDQNQKLWLFWLQQDGTRWLLKYNRHDGSQWESPDSLDLLPSDSSDPMVAQDLFVLIHQNSSNDDLISLYWTRNKSIPADSFAASVATTCKEIATCQKTGIDDISSGWGAVQVLPKESSVAAYDDREPAAIAAENGQIHLFWSSNRGGHWLNWNIKTQGIAAVTVTAAETVIDDLYSHRTPLPLILDRETNLVSLVYRSSKSSTSNIAGQSGLNSLDFASAGSTGTDERIGSRLGKKDVYEDFIHYSIETGSAGLEKIPIAGNRYTQDTIGLFLKPTQEDQHLINRNLQLIEGILDRFIPLLTRLVYIIECPASREYLYGYSSSEQERFIDENVIDHLSSALADEIFDFDSFDEVHNVTMPDWILAHTWSPGNTLHYAADEADTRYRSWHQAINWDN
jgi:hypothetical protein